MIKINLLPAEKRKAERTPLPRFFLIVMNAAALVLFALGIAFYVFIKIPMIERETADLLKERQDLQRDVERHDQLEKDFRALQAKVAQINQLTNRNLEWWQAINSVWDVIVENDKVWIDEMKLMDSKGLTTEIKKTDPTAKDTPPYGLQMKCHVAGDEVATVTKFRKALRDNPTLKKLMPGLNINVEWKKDDEKDFPEGNSLSFVVTLIGPVQAPPPPAARPAPPRAPGAPGATPVSAPAPVK